MNYKLGILLLMTGVTFQSLAGDAKKRIYTPDSPAPIGTYSQAIQHRNTIYISGQIGIDPKTGELVRGNFSEQLNQVFVNIAEIAKAADGNVNDILKLTIYVTDLNNFNAVNEVMKGFFHMPYPARAVIEIKALPKHALVEVEAVMGLIGSKFLVGTNEQGPLQVVRKA